MKKNVLIIAGEPSGDVRAGELISEIKKINGGISFWGIGGDAMSSAGVELVEHVRNLSIIGLWEAVRNVFKIYAQFKNIKSEVLKRKPDFAILIDYPGFNLRIAPFLKKHNIPVIYYIIPQIWAWGKNRIKLIKRYVDKAIVLFDFEEKLLKSRGIDCTFAGHPLVDKLSGSGTQAATHESRLTNHDSRITIALLPGSRANEVRSLFPVMLGAARKLSISIPGIKFVLARTSVLEPSLYDDELPRFKDLSITSVFDDTFRALSESDFALVASGTATLETAISEVPMIIVYKASAITMYAFILFVKIPFIGLVNIIAGKEVAPELLQHKATVDNLYVKTYEMISNKPNLMRIKKELNRVKASLGEKGASRRAAEAVIDFIDKR